MIYLYAGTPGSGKSYHVAKDICFNLWRGVDIIANFDVNRDMIKKYKGNFFYCDNFDMNPFMLKCYAMRNHKRKENGHIIEGQTLLIIDECQIIFNCRSWNDHNRQEWCSFFTQHRKYGYNIILVSQCDRLIDSLNSRST